EMQSALLRSGPMVVGPQLDPTPRLSNPDGPAPICRPRPLARGMWTLPGSAPPANLDTAQSVLLAAATARESAVRRAAPARSVAGLGCPGRVRPEPTGSAARSRTTESTTRGKPSSACPIHALRTPQHVRESSCT